MGSFSLAHWLVVLAIVLLLFGAGRLPNAMKDLARGVRAFRTGIGDNKPEGNAEKLVEAHAADQRSG
jgi:sec-independent protein translocase protein TatA